MDSFRTVRTLTLSLLWSVAVLSGAEPKPAKPNIVVFLADDMNWHFPGFNGGLVQTPNLDRLAKEGISLKQFYVSCVCSPTRASFLTGRYPFRNGMEERSHGNDVAGMLPDERTLAQALKPLGYDTALIGKWHLGNWFQRQLPLQRGFDYQYGFYGALISYYTKNRDLFYDWHRNGETIREDGYTTDLFAKEFEKVVAAQNKEKPFFYYVAFNAIHSPNEAPQELVAKYRPILQAHPEFPGTRASAAASANLPVKLAMLDSLDQAVGKMMAALEAKGVLENTLVVFFNDNGGVGENPPFRGGKTQNYEGGVRVPCLLRWPGHLPADQSIKGLVDVVDLYPTFLNLVGGSLDQPLPLDGMDMWDVFTGHKPSPRHEVVHGVPGSNVETGEPALCQDQWKVVGPELYDLDHDPEEKTNLAAQHPELVQKLTARLQQLATERRPPEKHSGIPDKPLLVFGQEENAHPPEWLAEYVKGLTAKEKKGRRSEK